MSKSADAFRTISEVAEWLDTPAHVLRFWESKFSQIKPVKRAGGRRYYRPADMMLVGGIKKLLHDDGLTIKGAQKILREQGVKHVAALSIALDDEIDIIDTTTDLASPTAERPDLGIGDPEPDLANVAIEVPLAEEDSEANILQFQREELAVQETDISTADTTPAPEMGTEADTVIDTVPAPDVEIELETKTEIAVESEATDPVPVTESFSPGISDAVPIETHAPEMAPELTENPTQPNTDQTTDPLTDIQLELKPDKASEPQPDMPAHESEMATEARAETADEPTTVFEAAPEEHPETTSETAPEALEDIAIVPEISSEPPVEDAASEPSFAPSFSHRPPPEMAPELPPEASESPQNTVRADATEKESLSFSADPVQPPVSEIEPDTLSGTSPEIASASEPEIEENVAPPRPNDISVPDDPADDMTEDPANSAAAAHILAILAAKADGVNATQKTELMPLLDRLGALQTKMLAQRKD